MLPKKLTVPLNGTKSRIPFAIQKQMPADLYSKKIVSLSKTLVVTTFRLMRTLVVMLRK
jgi:hypothetical protein